MGVELERRMLITGLFGLVHGFGFSYGLQENFQFAGTHLLVSLFAFNVGIELGQILVLVVMLPAARRASPLRAARPGRHDHPVGDRRRHRLALDDRARRRALATRRGRDRALAGLAMLAFWIAGILLAAGGLRFVAKRLRFDTARARLRRKEARRTDRPRPTATRFGRRLGCACGSRAQRGDCCESPSRRG